MKAVGYRQPAPISQSDALVDADLAVPEPGARDLLVEVRAVSVNPIDTKVRAGAAAQPDAADALKVIGWDAAGVVTAVGPEVTLFAPGDSVWYAGELMRPGSNAEQQVVDERIVGHKPASLEFAAAAAMPLTTLTAWELLFDRLGLAVGKAATDDRLLIIGAAGGVGSIMTQLAARLTGVTVIGTARRAESADWARALGAHHVIDHGKPLSQELARLGIDQVSHVASLTHTDDHFDEIVACLAPQGRLGAIDSPQQLDVNKLKPKCLSLHWEFMFARSLFGTPDMIAQHRILEEVAALIDAGLLRSTQAEHFGAVNAVNLTRAHERLESHTARGKIVLEGFG